MIEMESFWMVYGIGKRGPTRRHESQEAATAEAERLAALHPGTTFYVLASQNAVAVEPAAQGVAS